MVSALSGVSPGCSITGRMGERRLVVGEHRTYGDRVVKDQRAQEALDVTDAAGFPMRDRYGFIREDDVLFVLRAMTLWPDDDEKVGEAIGLANLSNLIQIAENDAPCSEEYEQGIIAALRPLVARKRSTGNPDTQ